MKISEHFFSIQGEGKYQGHSAVFLRLTGCNLLCGLKSEMDKSWICDSYSSWKQGKNYTIEEIILLFKVKQYTINFLKGSHLIITGGEPLLQKQELIILIEYLKKMIPDLFIEIETNGTIEIDNNLAKLIDIFNISPKLINSGETNERRKININLTILKDYILKFVISNKNDLKEVKKIQDEFNVPDNKIYLMPSCDNKKELNKKLPFIAKLCNENNYNLSNRLHIQIWNKTLGV